MNRQHRERFFTASSKQQRWMISYADFITLLFAFFVFLFSISVIEQEKFSEVSATLLQLFNVRPSSIDPIELETTPQGPDVFNPLFRPEPIPATSVDVNDSQIYHQESSLIDIQAQLGDQFSQLIEQQLFSVSGDEAWIEIQIADSITFSENSADINDRAEAVLYEIAKLLAAMSLPVAVEGYSSEPQQGNETQGWQLSSARAVTVVEYLENAGIAGERLSAIAFSHYQPRFVDSDLPSEDRIHIVVSGFGAGSGVEGINE